MNPEQAAKWFHGECARPDPDTGNFVLWCRTHEAMWRDEDHCDEMTDSVELAEHAVEEYQADLRAKVEALRDQATVQMRASTGPAGFMHKDYRDAYQIVLALIDGSNDE